MLFSRDIFDPPTRTERWATFPIQCLVTHLYNSFTSLRFLPPPPNPIRVVCISDTHTQQCPIPEGDILIHAGDLTNKGTPLELQSQIDWLSSLPHPHKLVISGNHDTFLDPHSRKTLAETDQLSRLDWKDIKYLQNTTLTLSFPSISRTLTIHGAPHVPKCGGSSFAFQYNRETDPWSNTIPPTTDILITHTPPKYHLDLQHPWLGCGFLLKEVWRVRPRLHVFGHIHAAAGKEVVWWDDLQRVYEGCMARGKRRGLLRQLFSIHLWWDLVRVLFYGFTSVTGHWLGHRDGEKTTLVNAAMMDWRTGKLKNTVQVVDI